jgi:hypothetical protein
MHLLEEQLKERIKKKYVSEKTVKFNEEVGRSGWDKNSSRLNSGLKYRGGVLLQNPAMNRITRAKLTDVIEAEEKLSDDENEEFAFDNVLECEELTELRGRKFHDEGRLYEIHQVRYDEEYKMVIGFRRPISGLTRREDGSAFAVYGKEGLYALSERYLLEHQEKKETESWPRNNVEWVN